MKHLHLPTLKKAVEADLGLRSIPGSLINPCWLHLSNWSLTTPSSQTHPRFSMMLQFKRKIEFEFSMLFQDFYTHEGVGDKAGCQTMSGNTDYCSPFTERKLRSPTMTSAKWGLLMMNSSGVESILCLSAYQDVGRISCLCQVSHHIWYSRPTCRTSYVDSLGTTFHPISMLAAMRDAHVKDCLWVLLLKPNTGDD